eukprot:scaffold655_cov225-Pinguiococcus_pyrenoidosus.AAC.14
MLTRGRDSLPPSNILSERRRNGPSSACSEGNLGASLRCAAETLNLGGARGNLCAQRANPVRGGAPKAFAPTPRTETIPAGGAASALEREPKRSRCAVISRRELRPWKGVCGSPSVSVSWGGLSGAAQKKTSRRSAESRAP